MPDGGMNDVIRRNDVIVRVAARAYLSDAAHRASFFFRSPSSSRRSASASFLPYLSHSVFFIAAWLMVTTMLRPLANERVSGGAVAVLTSPYVARGVPGGPACIGLLMMEISCTSQRRT